MLLSNQKQVLTFSHAQWMKSDNSQIKIKTKKKNKQKKQRTLIQTIMYARIEELCVLLKSLVPEWDLTCMEYNSKIVKNKTLSIP